jgi:hypothetical protein
MKINKQSLSMKFKSGDIILDSRDGEVLMVKDIDTRHYLCEVLVPGDGGARVGRQMGVTITGEKVRRRVENTDPYFQLDETYRVTEILKRYDE